MSDVICRAMKIEEAPLVIELVERVFERDVAPDYSEQGRQEFLSYACVDQFVRRAATGHRVLVAVHGERIVGMIETREARHISLFFVDGPAQRSGVGKALLRAAFDCGVLDSAADITVHAGRRSVAAYEKYGFRIMEAEQVKNGIRFVPMIFRKADGGG